MHKYLNILVFLVSISVFAQEPGMRNFTTKDGLPSDEVYHSFIDKEGYMWFATNSGVCFYDGSSFSTLDIADGLPDNTILDIEEDQNGRVWFAGISGNLSYFDNGKIIPFKYNYLIHQEKRQAELIASGGFQPIDTNEVIITTNQAKRIYIKSKYVEVNSGRGVDTVLISREKDRYKMFFFHDEETQLSKFVAVFNDSLSVTYEERFPDFTIDFINYRLYQEFEDKIIYFFRKQAIVFYKSGEVESISLDFKANYSLKGIYGGLWVGTRSKGLMFFDKNDLSIKPKLNILNNRRVTSLRYDQNTRGWVTTFSGGIYHVQSLYITNYFYPYSDDKNRVAKIIKLKNGITLGFSLKNSVFKFENNYQNFELIEIPELQNEHIYSVKEYENLLYVATTNHMVVVHHDYFLGLKEKYKPKVYPINNVKDFIIQDSILWVVTSGGLFYFPDLLKNKSDRRQRLPNYKYQRSNIITEYNSEFNEAGFSYLVYNDLKTIYKIRYEKNKPRTAQYASFQIPDTIPVSSANDIRMINGHIFISSKGMGLIIIHEKGTMQYLNMSNGLNSNYIKKVEVIDDQKLYLATNKGLNVLYFSNSSFSQVDSVKQITDKDGLLSDHINDFIKIENHVLCATNRGLSLINIPVLTNMKDKFPIIIKEFKVNNKNVFNKNTEHYELGADENNLIISFDAIDFHDKEGIKYYYFLEGSEIDDWNEISEPIVVFPKMTAGEYNFLVKSRNSYGFESENIASISFSISKKFYRTWYFRIALFLSFAALIFFIIRFYYSRTNQLLKTEKELAIYQQQSLTRVINPHFLMNIFNSINSNLFLKKTTNAMAYIKDTGDLVKHIFNSSYYNKITIEEEVQLLKSYINIEKRRSPIVFIEVIKYSEELKTYFIPSLMFQIFVENAIHHGFSDFKKRGALLSVIFKEEKDFIICEITDNGMGITESKLQEKSKPHKPRKHGIDIIRERIKLLNKNQDTNKYELEIKEVVSEKTNKVIGVKVVAAFPKQGKKKDDNETNEIIKKEQI